MLLLLVVFGIAGCALRSAPPVARFAMDPPAGTSPLLVRFDASSSMAGDGGIAEYRWEFGDGSAGAGAGTAHLYTTDVERTFLVTLKVIDREGREARASDTLTVAPPPPPPAGGVEFVWPFHFDASGEDEANLNDEYFALQNTGETSIDMTGWTVENERGQTYRFPDGFTLSAGAFVYIHSGAGFDSSAVLYWNAAAPVWSNTTDIAILRNAASDIVDIYGYASC